MQMINKQNLWFITLFSLILILGIYYISGPSNAFDTANETKGDMAVIAEVDKNDVLVALKVASEEELLTKMEEARSTLLDNSASASDKNEAYETLQTLNTQKGQKEKIEKLIKEKFNLDACAKIEGNKINLTVLSNDKNATLANNIIKEVNNLYKENMYVTVNFQS